MRKDLKQIHLGVGSSFLNKSYLKVTHASFPCFHLIMGEANLHSWYGFYVSKLFLFIGYVFDLLEVVLLVMMYI